MLVVRYSQFDDIITLTPGPTKDIVSSIEGKEITGFSGFFDPVDLTENVKNGNIYVSEYGGGKITLLKPHNGKTVAKSNEAAIVSVSPPAKEYPSCDDTVAIASQTEMTAGAGQIADISERPRINPNPVHKKFDVEFPKTYEGDFTLQIIDPLGKVYGVGEKRLSRGGSNISIDISKFSFVPGVYFLKIQSDVKTDVIKLLVQ